MLSIIAGSSLVFLIGFGHGQTLPQTSDKIENKLELIVQTGHTSLVNSIALSPDGNTLVSGGGDNAVRLWDIKEGRLLKSFIGHNSYVLTVAFSSDGNLASGSWDNTVKIWDLETGENTKTLRGHLSGIMSVRFSPDGKILATGGLDTTVRLWNTGTGEQIRMLSGHLGGVMSVTFSPDGKVLASGGFDKTIRLWNVKTGEALGLLEGHTEGVLSAAFSPDGKTLASGGGDKTVRLWNLSTKKEIIILGNHEELVYSVAFSPDKTILASGGGTTIKLWDLQTQKEIRSLEGHTGFIRAVAFYKDILASGGSIDNTIKLWDINTGKQVNSLEGHASHIMSVAVSPKGAMMASGNFDHTIRLWTLKNKPQIRTLKGHTDQVITVAFSPDEKLLASGSKDKSNTIKLWDTDSGEIYKSLEGHSFWINSVAFSPDGKTLGSGSEDDKIKLWDVAGGKEIISIDADSKGVNAIAFSNDGKIIVSGGKDNTVRLWASDTGEEIAILKGHNAPVSSVKFSPDGKILASSSKDNRIKLWNTETREQFKSLEGTETDKFTSLAFSPDGKTLVSGSEDNSIKLWNVETGDLKNTLKEHNKEVSAIAFFPEENRFVSSSWDANVKVWQTDSNKSIASIIPLDTEDWAVITSDGWFDASKNAFNLMHYVYGSEIIELEQLKNEYYEPGLLNKLLGYSKHALRSIVPINNVRLFPKILEQNFDKETQKLTIKLKIREGGIGETRILVNGKMAVSDARDARLKADPYVSIGEIITLSADLKGASFLKNDENEITVITSNYLKDINKGNMQSRKVSRGVEVFVDNDEFIYPKLYAVIGGISDYEGNKIDLGFAAKDAEDFSYALNLGAKRLFCDKEKLDCSDRVQITTLSTSGKEGTIQPTKENFKKTIEEISRKAKAEDIIVIYLAGHGISFRNKNTDTYFFLTKEANSAETEYIEKTFQTVTISGEEITDWLTLDKEDPKDIFVKALKQVIVLDTCAAGRVAASLPQKKARDLSPDQIRAIEFLKDKTGTFVLMGSTADAPSYESSEYGQGLLTYSLLQAMQGAQLDGEYVDVRKLFSYAEQKVPMLAKNIKGVQQPEVFSPSGKTFAIGQMIYEDRQKIKLPTPKPLILRPILFNPEEMDDNLKLTPKLSKRLDAESSYEVTQGRGDKQPAIIYIDEEGIPGAIRLTGNYSVENGQIKVNALLKRDNRIIVRLPEIVGEEDFIIEELVKVLLSEIQKIKK